MIDADLSEQLRIRTLLEQYFYAIDSRDEEMLAACFMPDATAHYHRGFATEVLLKTAEGIAQFLLRRTSVYAATNHLSSNMHIEAGIATGRVVMHAIAHCIVAAEPKILVRGIRYEDELVRSDDGWRIRHRVHIPQWQYDTVAVPPAIPVAT